MESLHYQLKIKIFYQNKEILKIRTPEYYSDLRKYLSKNPKCKISDTVVLNYMDDSGDYLIINNEVSYKSFLSSSNGLCHYIEINDGDLESLKAYQKWKCSYCLYDENSLFSSKCIHCGDGKKK